MTPFSRPSLSFATKVLLPIVGIMVALVVFTSWIINVRIARQVERQAAETLHTSQAVFTNVHSMRSRQWQAQCRNIPNDPRFKAVAQLGEAKTLRFLLVELLDELQMDLLSYLPLGGDALTVTRHDLNPAPGELEHLNESIGPLVLEGGSTARTVPLGTAVVNLAAAPVKVGDHISGALIMGKQFTDAEAFQLRKLTGCDMTYYVGDLPVVTTLAGGFHRSDLSYALGLATAEPGEIVLDGNHYLAVREPVWGLNQDDAVTCLLLSSIEPQLLALRDTQRVLLAAGVAGILLSALFAWLVIGRVAHPLHQLRISAEAVGRGEYAATVDARGHDEIGDLARSFNLMIHNLQTSRAKLEKTVSTLQDTRARLVQSEKLSAIGEFIAGVAHELNNPLTVMVGFSQLLQESDMSEEHKQDVRQIAESSDRCHKIVQNLLSFARQRPPERTAVDINELVEGTAKFLGYEMRTSNIEVIQQLGAHLPAIWADPYQIQQIILNIMNNARQAIEASRDRGHLTLTTCSSGDAVRVLIEDDGPGIPPQHLEKLFDPFFTTKEPGKGTGLGLSVSYGIVKEHGGEIRVESTVGKGTTFLIDLPVAGKDAVVLRKSGGPAIASAGKKNGKIVLVVDDEESILGLTQKMLTGLGFEVETALDGQAALRKLRKNHYDIVLCDWKMPGMNGQQLYQRLMDLQPAMAAHFLFMTGDVLNQHMLAFVEEHSATVLAKPFSIDEFRAALQEGIL